MAARYADLRDFIDALEKQGELKRIDLEVECWGRRLA